MENVREVEIACNIFDQSKILSSGNVLNLNDLKLFRFRDEYTSMGFLWYHNDYHQLYPVNTRQTKFTGSYME